MGSLMPEVTVGQDGSFESSSFAAEESARVDAARAELYDEAAGSPEGAPILGKYNSVDDLAAAYQSLQAEYSRLKNGQVAAPEQEQQQYEQTDDDEDEGDQPTPIALERAQQIRERVMQQAGGDQQYQRIAGWASQNLPTERVNAFNAALNQGDEGAILNQLKGLQYDFMMANGYEPKLSGGRAPSQEVKGFGSEAQVIEAMNDPRYSGQNPDPAYIREVERRIAVSNVFQAR
jgi:hypothetical protein